MPVPLDLTAAMLVSRLAARLERSRSKFRAKDDVIIISQAKDDGTVRNLAEYDDLHVGIIAGCQPQGDGIFISYRRKDSSHFSGRLFDHLVDSFGEYLVFIDVNKIKPGIDFSKEIIRAVEMSSVMLAVIGPQWLSATDEQGRRRLDDSNDIVRLEIEAALTRKIWLIPILMDNATMPRRQDLPGSLAGLADRNEFRVRHESFREDVNRLTTELRTSRHHLQLTPWPARRPCEYLTPLRGLALARV